MFLLDNLGYNINGDLLRLFLDPIKKRIKDQLGIKLADQKHHNDLYMCCGNLKSSKIVPRKRKRKTKVLLQSKLEPAKSSLARSQQVWVTNVRS